jgi:endonuclease YncB( thermonuclease family)
MTKLQFLVVVLGTTLFLVVGLAITNYYFRAKETNPTIQRSERPPQSQEPAQPELGPRSIEGKIVGITDGDTVKVLTPENRQYVIRLAGIDAPERSQDFGQKAKAYLSGLIFDQNVQINATKIDKYGRTLGQIYVGEKDINLEIVKAGLAWHYKKYENEQTEGDRRLYADAEIQARKKKIGIWSLPRQIPPWEFRHPELTPPKP